MLEQIENSSSACNTAVNLLQDVLGKLEAVCIREQRLNEYSNQEIFELFLSVQELALHIQQEKLSSKDIMISYQEKIKAIKNDQLYFFEDFYSFIEKICNFLNNQKGNYNNECYSRTIGNVINSFTSLYEIFSNEIKNISKEKKTSIRNEILSKELKLSLFVALFFLYILESKQVINKKKEEIIPIINRIISLEDFQREYNKLYEEYKEMHKNENNILAEIINTNILFYKIILPILDVRKIFINNFNRDIFIQEKKYAAPEFSLSGKGEGVDDAHSLAKKYIGYLESLSNIVKKNLYILEKEKNRDIKKNFKEYLQKTLDTEFLLTIAQHVSYSNPRGAKHYLEMAYCMAKNIKQQKAVLNLSYINSVNYINEKIFNKDRVLDATSSLYVIFMSYFYDEKKTEIKEYSNAFFCHTVKATSKLLTVENEQLCASYLKDAFSYLGGLEAIKNLNLSGLSVSELSILHHLSGDDFKLKNTIMTKIREAIMAKQLSPISERNDKYKKIALLDFDNTLLVPFDKEGFSFVVNLPLLNELKKKDICDIYLFTDYHLSNVFAGGKNCAAASSFTRADVIAILQDFGFQVNGVITPCDIVYPSKNEKPGDYFEDEAKLFETEAILKGRNFQEDRLLKSQLHNDEIILDLNQQYIIALSESEEENNKLFTEICYRSSKYHHEVVKLAKNSGYCTPKGLMYKYFLEKTTKQIGDNMEVFIVDDLWECCQDVQMAHTEYCSQNGKNNSCSLTLIPVDEKNWRTQDYQGYKYQSPQEKIKIWLAGLPEELKGTYESIENCSTKDVLELYKKLERSYSTIKNDIETNKSKTKLSFFNFFSKDTQQLDKLKKAMDNFANLFHIPDRKTKEISNQKNYYTVNPGIS